eukprot:scaffold42_cov229-Chaetoceros_neogracile.AAC.4
MERIVDSRRMTIGGAVGDEDVIATTSNDSIEPRKAAAATPPLSSQSTRNLYSIRTSESLSTPFNQDNESKGNMFQVNAINCVVIRAMHVNNNERFATATFNVYKKSGALLLSDTTDSSQWTMIGNAIDVTLLTRNVPSPLPEDAFTAIHMDAGTSVSLYVTRTDGSAIGYTDGIAVGNVAAENNDIEILEGYGNQFPFGSAFFPRVWNGIIEYDSYSCAPSVSPSLSKNPSNKPSVLPSDEPSVLPSDDPSVLPSDEPSVLPSDEPSVLPSDEPSVLPSDEPSVLPSDEPSVLPSNEPSVLPSEEPSVLPSDEPSVLPSDKPSVLPMDEPSVLPSDEPSMLPFDEPSVLPSDEPSVLPSDEPSVLPSDGPSVVPRVLPSDEPSVLPTDEPSVLRSDEPSVLPLDKPSALPSEEPSVLPSVLSSDEPSVKSELRAFNIVSSFKFDDSRRQWCLQAKNVRVNAKFNMRPCIDSRSKQKFYLDEHDQLRLRDYPTNCMRWKKKSIYLGYCPVGTETSKANFTYEKDHQHFIVQKPRFQYLLGVSIHNKYEKVRLFKQGGNINDSTKSWSLHLVQQK